MQLHGGNQFLQFFWLPSKPKSPPWLKWLGWCFQICTFPSEVSWHNLRHDVRRMPVGSYRQWIQNLQHELLQQFSCNPNEWSAKEWTEFQNWSHFSAEITEESTRRLSIVSFPVRFNFHIDHNFENVWY